MFQIYMTIICSPMVLIRSLVILIGEGDLPRTAPTRFSPLLFMFL